MSVQSDLNITRRWGFWGVLVGAIGLGMVFWNIAAPMMEPSPSIGSQIGEIAGDMRRAAWRSFFGLEAEAPAEVATPWTAYLAILAPGLGLLAIVLSVISGVKGENRRFVLYGTGLGASAIVFHFFWLVALLVVGMMLLIAVVENIGDIFGGGLFGG